MREREREVGGKEGEALITIVSKFDEVLPSRAAASLRTLASVS